MKYPSPSKTALNSLLILSALFACSPQLMWARAGGGGGGGGGIVAIILLPFFLIYSAIVTHKVRKKNKECAALLMELGRADPAWDIANLKRRISQVYFKVQQAWMERDQDIAKSYMSEALFEKHRWQTDQMIADHQKNILERINLIETDIVDVEDFADNKKDQFWVYLKGSMIDYMINDLDNSWVSGKREVESFTELWKFIRSGNNWVLDEIDQKVSLGQLGDFGASTEG